jgi:cytochrome c553
MKKTSLLAACLMMISSVVAHAAGDPKAGEAKAELCFDCHGAGGNSEDSTFPKLAGQFDYYIIKQIKDFKSGARKDDTMTDMAMMIETDQDIEDIAAYFSAQPDMVGEPTDPPLMVERTIAERGKGANVVSVPMVKLGKDIYMDGALTKCFECHGADARGGMEMGGGGMMKGAPKLAGQHKDYMLKAMNDIFTRKRHADMFNLMWRGLNTLDKGEWEYVAEYLSGIQAAE